MNAAPSTFRFEPTRPLRLAVLISGGGTTLRNLIQVIQAGQLDARIERVVSSSATAGGLQFAAAVAIPAATINPRQFDSEQAFSQAVFDECRAAGVDVVALGGFLKHLLIPSDFENRVVNIHPALLPGFGGKGFYGHRVHEAVLASGARVSGCTVHFVDNLYDHGPIILQRQVPVLDDDTPEVLAARIFAAECEAYPDALRLIGAGKVTITAGKVRVG